MKVSRLPYHPDSENLFAKVADEPWSMFLDSVHSKTEQGRYDLIVARPQITLETYGQLTHIHEQGVITSSTDNPFTLVTKL